MLHTWDIQFTQTTLQAVNSNWGSVMHGLLYEIMEKELAFCLHNDQIKPFSQFVQNRFTNNEGIWKIYTWNDNLAEDLKPKLKINQTYRLNNKNCEIKISKVEYTEIAEHTWASEFFKSTENKKFITIKLITPCTHKQKGTYVLFPTIDLIINSLVKHFEMFSQTISVQDEDAIESIKDSMRIIAYDLHTAKFYLENTRITGYCGDIKIMLTGNKQLLNIATMLLSFAQYSGIGIKTTLGMGACNIEIQ